MEDLQHLDQEDTDVLSKEKIKNFFKGCKTTSDIQNNSNTKMSSPMDSDVYDFSHPRRGLAVIINNRNFLDPKHNRYRSEIDVIRLTRMFTCYNFDIVVYNDLTVDEMVNTLEMVASFPDHARADCFACAICSHGDEVTLSDENTSQDAIMGVSGDLVLTKVLIEIFADEKCPGLQGKPRLFFIQACRGELLDDGQDIQVSKLKLSPTEESSDSCVDANDKAPVKGGNSCPLCAPIFPHFLVMYASPPGHAAWRRDDGTWFIKCLVDIFLSTTLETTSLTKVLTLVSGAVSRLQSKSGKKQVPCVVSKLTKDIYLTAKKPR